jgi:hypothetical protein
MTRHRKPRVLATFEARFCKCRVVDRTRTPGYPRANFAVEIEWGQDALGEPRWITLEPHEFKHNQDGTTGTKMLRYFTEGDVHAIVYALAGKLRRRRSRKERGQ